jgi:hypothetical protein
MAGCPQAVAYPSGRLGGVPKGGDSRSSVARRGPRRPAPPTAEEAGDHPRTALIPREDPRRVVGTDILLPVPERLAQERSAADGVPQRLQATSYSSAVAGGAAASTPVGVKCRELVD